MMKTSSTSRKITTKGTSISAEEVRGYFLEISQSTRKTKALLRKVGIVSSGNTKKTRVSITEVTVS